jgi:hypothetical protein
VLSPTNDGNILIDRDSYFRLIEAKPMTPTVYFVVGIDSDPKRSFWGTNDDDLLSKYYTTLNLMKRWINMKAIICVHTSPQYRDRFFEPPFLRFWESWVQEGGELMLHPENYQLTTTRTKTQSEYLDLNCMEALIREKTSFMKGRGLPFTAFRGGFFGLTDGIVKILKRMGIRVDLSCCPELVRPERAADWSEVPASAYYMSRTSYRRPARRASQDSIFEIPLGWDGKGLDLSHHYLFHERSTYGKMSKVWDAIVDRSHEAGRPQFANFLCHTYSMANSKFRTQLERILNYMRSREGVPVTANEAKKIYDRLQS